MSLLKDCCRYTQSKPLDVRHADCFAEITNNMNNEVKYNILFVDPPWEQFVPEIEELVVDDLSKSFHPMSDICNGALQNGYDCVFLKLPVDDNGNKQVTALRAKFVVNAFTEFPYRRMQIVKVTANTRRRWPTVKEVNKVKMSSLRAAYLSDQ